MVNDDAILDAGMQLTSFNLHTRWGTVAVDHPWENAWSALLRSMVTACVFKWASECRNTLM
jgi:hypothetical protein